MSINVFGYGPPESYIIITLFWILWLDVCLYLRHKYDLPRRFRQLLMVLR